MKTLAAIFVSVLLLAAGSDAAERKMFPNGFDGRNTPGNDGRTVPASAIIVPGVRTPWPGKIFVANDEWALSDTGFAAAPDAEKLALNIAAWFGNGLSAKFLVYSTNWSLTGQRLAQTMTGAGHSWTINTAMEFTLPNLLQYDAVFIAGDVLDTSVLTDYVRAGGHVYLAGGTAWFGPLTEAGRWNPFLNAFGLNFDYEPLPLSRVVLPVSSTSPLFKGVTSLWLLDDYGMAVQTLDASNPTTKTVLSYSGRGLSATYAADVIPVATEICPSRLAVASNGWLAAALVGSATFDVRTIDPASVQVAGVASRGALYDYGAVATRTTGRHLGKTTVASCTMGRPDKFLDLVVVFEARDIIKAVSATLGRSLGDDETIALTLTGRLKKEFGGTPILGESLVVTVKRDIH